MQNPTNMTANKEKLKELITKQIKKMDEKAFDLDAWKKSTIIILEKLFGPKDNRIHAIDSLHYDYGSWSLRDTTGKSMTKEACVKTGKAILETALDELEVFGEEAAEIKAQADGFKNDIIEILDDELRGSEFRELKKILEEKGTNETEKQNQVAMVIRNFGEDTSASILARILVSTQIDTAL